MPISHTDLIINSEDLLLNALMSFDKDIIFKMCHKDLVFTNEVGKTFYGVENLQVLRPEILKINTIKILQRDIHLFDTTAVVSSLERRSGSYMSLPISGNYHLTRIWKFKFKWQLISTTSIMVG